MRRGNRQRSIGTIATAATVLIGSNVDPAPAGQAQGTLGVTVRVIAACGGAVGSGGAVSGTESCAPDSAPLAVTTEVGPTRAEPAADGAAGASLEGAGELRYVTLIY
jgi:hypothetical protein